MRYAQFKNHKIRKTCDRKYRDYRKYAPYLQADFSGRCCYCNMPENLITSPFHVEHFIPWKLFEGIRDELKTDYNNLMWSCPKCNRSKGDRYQGDYINSGKIENTLFYNPVETDYNDIFYRNEFGGIASDDSKGMEMIKLLKLYRPLYNRAWLVERLELLSDELEDRIVKEENPEKRAILEEAVSRISRIHMKEERGFRAAYKG